MREVDDSEKLTRTLEGTNLRFQLHPGGAVMRWETENSFSDFFEGTLAAVRFLEEKGQRGPYTLLEYDEYGKQVRNEQFESVGELGEVGRQIGGTSLLVIKGRSFLMRYSDHGFAVGVTMSAIDLNSEALAILYEATSIHAFGERAEFVEAVQRAMS